MKAKFKQGDQVRIVKYGHPMWIAGDEFKIPNHYILLQDKDGLKTYDSNPHLVGQIGFVDTVTLTQGKFQYSLNGPNKHAWYDEQQLELVQSVDYWKDEMKKCIENPYYFFTNYFVTEDRRQFATILTEEEFNEQFKKLFNGRKEI